MAENEDSSKPQIDIVENKPKESPEKLCSKEEVIDLDASDGSDIEIIKVSTNIAARKRRNRIKNAILNWKRTKIHVNSVNCSIKSQQESYIKEEIIISDATDSSDNDDTKKLTSATRRTVGVGSNPKSLENGKVQKRNESLSSIILNCPRCNKTETVFSATIKCVCKECKVNMSYVCNKCNYYYESMLSLYRHKKLQCKSVLLKGKSLAPMKLFVQKCSKCQATHKVKKTRCEKQRCRKCKLNMLFECTVCSKNYTSYSGMYLHAKNACQPSLRAYYCNDCSYKTTSQLFLLRHLSQIHKMDNSPSIHCRKCSKKLENASQLEMHEFSCGIPFFQCKFCTYKPRLLENLKKHLKNHHQVEQQENMEKILIEVVTRRQKTEDDEFTSNGIRNDYNLNELKQVHCFPCRKSAQFIPGCLKCPDCKTSYNYECNGCQKMFKTAPSLYRHVRRQHGNLTHGCSKCGRSFSFLGDANEHSKSCGQEPRYECVICYFKTRYKYNLRCHMEKLHNVNRENFGCPYCGVKYKTAKSINRHLKNGCTKNTELA